MKASLEPLKLLPSNLSLYTSLATSMLINKMESKKEENYFYNASPLNALRKIGAVVSASTDERYSIVRLNAGTLPYESRVRDPL